MRRLIDYIARNKGIGLMALRCFVIIGFSIFTMGSTYAQQDRDAARYEIDAKRIGVNSTDKDALPRSREFIRLDSTYYVGWMYEGMYKFDRSADYLGYKNAIPALRKAFLLMQKDYKDLFSNFFAITNLVNPANIKRFTDFNQVTESLKECYDNLEMPDSVLWVVDKYDKFNFAVDEIGVNTTKAWTFHRNRFFTSAKYPFLYDNVEGNEKAALAYCYKSLARVDEYNGYLSTIYGPNAANMANGQKQATYHYLALLHCYLKNYDSSEYYYQKLMEGGGISWNNYGGMQAEIGNFGNAIEDYEKDQDKYFRAGMLREPYYYLPELFVYSGRTKQAIDMSQNIITQSGSTPGFGWYNIALARGYLYDGQLDSSEDALNKAANFKELHIGTTLTQSQYDFTINLLRVQLDDKKMALIKFLNQGWWYSPKSLYNLASLKAEKLMAEYVVINQLIFNPERGRTVYDLFCGEATSTYDEAWFLLKDFSTTYFIKKYQNYQVTDKRVNIQRYFKLFEARFKLDAGKDKEALQELENLNETVQVDTAHEKLFIARLYESLATIYDDNGDKVNFDNYRNQMFLQFPELVPFSGLEMEMVLNTSGTDDGVTKKVVSDLKDCNIKWVTAARGGDPTANITFVKKGDEYEALIDVSVGGRTVISGQKILFSQADGVGGEIALRMFGKGGAIKYDPPPTNTH